MNLGKFNEVMQQMQDELSREMKTGKLGQVVKQCEKEKRNFNATQDRIKKYSDDINQFINKFDQMKEDIELYNKK